MVTDGTYFIKHMHQGSWSYLVLDVPRGQPDDGVIIIQWGWHGGPNQKWQIKNVGNDHYTIVSALTGKALDVPGGYPILGLAIQQYRLHGGPNQQWRFETFPAVRGPDLYRPEYHRIYNRATELALDIPNGSQRYGERLQQYRPHLGWNQTWILEGTA